MVSVFTVTIPSAVVSRLYGAIGQRVASSRRILVADDNNDAAESLAMLLRLEGHEVETVEDGEKAVQAFDRIAPDVVLLDIGMPLLSGYDVSSRLRARKSRALLVAITGWGQAQDRAKSAKAGFDHHLSKPVDFQELSAPLVTEQ